MGEMARDHCEAARPQFGLWSLFALTTLCAATLPFVHWSGPAAVVLALPLASGSCWRADALFLRVWYLLGAGLGVMTLAITITVTW